LALIRESMRAPLTAAEVKAGVQQRMEQLIPGATLVGTRGFAEAVIRHMDD
jgi:hypothetical protein